jgi:hypothetical protein
VVPFFVVFIWLGLCELRGTSLKMSPFLLAAYILPLLADGVAAGRAEECELLVAAADGAMYSAKRSGEGLVAVALPVAAWASPAGSTSC